MSAHLLIAIGLEALYQAQKLQVFKQTGHLLARNEFMRGGFPVVLNPIAVLLCAWAGMNVVQIEAPAPAAAAHTNGKRLQLIRG